MRIVILHDLVAADAREDELDVLAQAAFVRECLERLGHEVSTLEFGMDMGAAVRGLEAARPAVVFNLVESMMRSGRLIGVAPTLLDAMGIAYTGCPSESIWLSAGKLLSKRWMRAVGLPTADWFEEHELTGLCESGGTGGMLPALGKHVPSNRPHTPRVSTRAVEPGAWIVKSVWEHASVGLDEDSVIDVGPTDGARVLAGALARLKARVGGLGFVERFINGREFNIGLLGRGDRGARGGVASGPEALPPAEIEFRDFPPQRRKVVGFNAKWVEDSFAYQHTFRKYEFPASDAALLDEMRELSLRCWSEFGLRGYARVDFRVDERGRPWILEVNGNPCISPDAGFMAAAERAGMTGDEVVGRIVGEAG